MTRLSKSYLENRFKRVHEAMGWPRGPMWNAETRKFNVGTVGLEKAPGGGWRIIQISNEGGGQHSVTPAWDVYTARELDAWFEGVLFAKREA